MLKKLFNILKKIWQIIIVICQFFRRKPAPKPPPMIINIAFGRNENGKRIKIVSYSDGSKKITEISDEDPTDVDGFLHDIRS